MHWLKWLALGLAPLAINALADSGLLDFPAASDGRAVLAVDLHTHSVFSDGLVWPTVRVEEAEKDGLAALAITEHLEWQPHAQDLPHPDRNRAFELARELAEEQGQVLVINGAEISRGPDIGHINAVFIEDANKLLTPGKSSASEGEDFGARFQGDNESLREEALNALLAAREQGAFIFLNHPSWVGQRPDGRARLSAFQRDILSRGLVDGIEVSTGGHFSIDAFNIAMLHDLAILGTSDVHGLIAWDYADADDELNPGGSGARTVSLLLTRGTDPKAIRHALNERYTVALNDNQLFGRQRDLRPLLEGALGFSVGEQAQSYAGDSSVYAVTLHNTSPIPVVLRNVSDLVFADSSNFLTIPARSDFTLEVTQLPDPGQLKQIRFEVLNAFEEPDAPVEVMIRRKN